MPIFLLEGGFTDKPYPAEKLVFPEMFEDRYFGPGTIHGGDYLIRVYLNDNYAEKTEPYVEHNQFQVQYIYPKVVMEAAKEDPTFGHKFYDHISQFLTEFTVESIEKDFGHIARLWKKTKPLTNEQLFNWAKRGLETGNYFLDQDFENSNELKGLN